MTQSEPSSPSWSDQQLQQKIIKTLQAVGCRGLCLVLKLFFALKNPNLPRWARLRIYAALAYFISWIDAIPDLIPGVGYSDDLLVLAAAVATLHFYITDEVKAQAHTQAKKWLKNCDCSTPTDKH